MVRGRKCIPLKDRQRLIEAHEQGEDYVVIAHAMGLLAVLSREEQMKSLSVVVFVQEQLRLQQK